MKRTVGTVVRGVRTPIIKENDDLAEIVTQSILECAQSENFTINNKDVIGVTEAVVARSQGNYASVEQIAAAVKKIFPSGHAGVVFPISSRNRFSIIFKGLCMGLKKITLQMSYPSDEVGNELVSLDMLDEKNINPWTDVFNEEEFRKMFPVIKHRFTGMDYMKYYHEIADECNCELEIILANDVRAILNYQQEIICADIHSRFRSKRLLKAAGCKKISGLDEILISPESNSGYNPDYGLLGSNKATENTIKLFPRDCHDFVLDVQAKIFAKTGKKVEVLVYGDGAFCDPVGHIWELADPVVSPAFTDGLFGKPNEIKLKYLADNDFADLSGDKLKEAISNYIRSKSSDLKDSMQSMGTTPRNISDLIGSLCDLTSGSGDKGTPVIFIQGYFDDYSKDQKL